MSANSGLPPASRSMVLDDFLPAAQFRAMRDAIESEAFPWEPSAILRDAPPGLPAEANRQLVHGFYIRNARLHHVSPQFGIVRPIVEKLTPDRIIKVKLNLTLRQDHHIEYGHHLDTRQPGATTAVFYFNTNNGYTVFEDGERVDSVANRLVLFDASRPHTGASCTDAPYRLVLNINTIRPPGPPLQRAFRSPV